MKLDGKMGHYYAVIATGYVPTGIAFGAFAGSLHLGSLIPLTLSLAVYSGAAQSAFLGFIPLGLP
ncbi:MAG: AzlC family ABC transporter permease, partial [Thermoplasmataceae archaeon]